MSNTAISNNQIEDLRSRGLLKEEEVAFKTGDLVIAENPITGEKRVLGKTAVVLSESNKRVLKG